MGRFDYYHRWGGARVKKIIILICFLFQTSETLATSVGDFPGAIPKKITRRPATDLVYKGEVLLPDEAFELHKSGQVDISRLNPDDTYAENTPAIWKNKPSLPVDKSLDEVGLNIGDEVEFLSEVSSGGGRYRMSVIKYSSKNEPQTFTIMLSKFVHNVLMRKALLRKLGYNVPEIKYIKNLTVKIGPATKKSVLQRINMSTAGASSRWVTNSDDEDAEFMTLQDVVVLKNDNITQNLALGYVPESFIKGRRILNALLVPFNLVDVPESVNLFAWHPGRIIDGHVHLPYERADGFTTTVNDAKWIIRKLLKLTRVDFIEIASQSNTPQAVQKLLVEKLISRRNHYAKYFSINEEPEAKDIPFNSKISYGEFLKKGKLLKQDWSGYGSRFSFGDPQSPLSGSELKSFFKSKFLSNIISNFVQRINDDLIPSVDIKNKFYEHQLGESKKRFLNYLKTGENKETSFGFWSLPTASGRVIAARDIVVGNYLGADNRVQLADTIGFSVDAGLVFSGVGAPEGWQVSGAAKLFFTRTYTHLKPIKSMKKALKEPFKNMIVPLLNKKYASILNRVVAGRISEDEDEDLIVEVINEFKKSLEVGESLILSDSLGAGLNIKVGYGLAENIDLYLKFLAQQQVLSRLHILRSSENTIQIYKDQGGVKSIGVVLGIESYIPVASVDLEYMSGKAKTKFYSLNIDADLELNPEALSSIVALHSLFKSNSLELVEESSKPYIVKYKFKEKSSRFKFFHWRSLGLKQSNLIDLKTPKGEDYSFIRRTEGRRSGVDYQQMGLDVLNGLLNEYTEEEILIGASNNGNPGDSIFGHSKFRQVNFEASVERKVLKDSFVQINYRWKGWGISKAKANKLIDSISNKYGFSFYPSTAFNETKSIQLYSVDVLLNIYEKGIHYLASLSDYRIKEIFKKHSRLRSRALERAQRVLIYSKNRYLYNIKKGRASKSSKYALQMVNLAEKSFSLKGLFELIGGEENIYIYSKIQGFRRGDENGDQTLISNSIGRFGSERHSGVLNDVRSQIGMTESEFFLNWILKKL